MKKKVLFVCLGNICRSPAAEAIFLFKLREKKLLDKFEVDSAGTGGWHIGKMADSRMIEAASNRGVLIKSRARQISLNDFNYFDLILTMDNSNLRDVQSLSDELNCAFKAEIKPILEFSNSNYVEVPDPYYGGDQGFEKVLDLLEDSIDELIAQIT